MNIFRNFFKKSNSCCADESPLSTQEEAIDSVELLNREKISNGLNELIASIQLESGFSEPPTVIEENTIDDSDPATKFDRMIEESIAQNHLSYFWGDRLLTLDKSAGFLSDAKFKPAYDAIRGSHQYDQYTSPHTIAWRLHTLVWAAQNGMDLEGDFVECGVFKGDMSWVITQMIDLVSKEKKFYLYDTFEGFSDKYSSAEDFPEHPHFFQYAHRHYNDPSLYTYVCQRYAEHKHIKVLKGVVPDILLEEAPDKISFLHIDLNSPAAEIGALEILFPRLVSGGILIFDDYGWKQFHKQKEAEDQFMQERGYHILELPTGQGLVVKK